MQSADFGDCNVIFEFYVLFVKKKKNRSDSTSVVVVEKKRGKYVLIQMIGCAINAIDIENLVREGYKYIIGARIKNVSAEITNGYCRWRRRTPFFTKEKWTRTRINGSLLDTRAKKDEHNRAKGVKGWIPNQEFSLSFLIRKNV